jgi:DNA polymerase III delta prime subunit
MTTDAQTALRRTMEKYSKTTRFCIICNYISRIIEPIASRCAKFRYKPLTFDTMTAQLKRICDEEKIVYEDEVSINLSVAVSLSRCVFTFYCVLICDCTVCDSNFVNYHFFVLYQPV